MNKTVKKLTIAVVALALMLLGVVGGVVAWLTASTDTVTNTFTYGEIAITLEENGATTTGIAFTNVVPGDQLAKNPTVTVNAKSEACYVYVKITNNLVLSDKSLAATYTKNDGWTLIGTKTDANGVVTNLYRYDTKFEYSESAQTTTTAVFSTINYLGEELTKVEIEQLDGKTVEVSAYAHQADNTTPAAADAAAIAWAGVTATP